jgi:L-ascorbate metabolism protein UlaG (beta-lactamase superfamily)
VSWRNITDWAKRKPLTLRLADWLGRGRVGLRLLDRLHKPACAPGRPDLTRWDKHDLAAVWIGHATVLLRVGGLTILTDPVFSNRIGLGLGLLTCGPLRFLAPALSIRELPAIDLILVSHAHFDHLDRPTLNRLSKRIPVITAHHTADLVRDLGFTAVTEMRWGESLSVASVRLTALQTRHWGARAFRDQHRSFNAFLIEGAKRRVLYGGDTAFCDHFRAIGKVDLAIFGIGGYDPYIQAHASPEQVWHMADQVRADAILPMHHSTFRLSYEPTAEPIERMLAAAGPRRDRLVITRVGGQWAL